jgi:hypothetical protein
MDENKTRKYMEKVLSYKGHQYPKKCCSNCTNSEVTNPGANIPGLRCLIMDAMNKLMKIDFGDSQVHKESICKLYSGK